MKIKELIAQLQDLAIVDSEKEIQIACDEEWNTIFKDLYISKDEINNRYIMFGCEGEE